MIIQMITENQSRTVNDMKIQNSIFSQTPWDHSCRSFIRMTTTRAFRKGSIFLIMRNVSFETATNCPQKVTNSTVGGAQDGLGKGAGGGGGGRVTSKVLWHE